MIPQGRSLFALVTVVVLVVFFFAGPFSAKPAPVKQISNADARLARWIEVVSPPGRHSRPVHAYAASLNPPIRDQSKKPLVPINLYPLGKPSSNAEEYLNARKRGKLAPFEFIGQTETGDSLLSQNPGGVKSPTGSESPAVKGPNAGSAPAAKKKGGAAGLSPLDSLPAAALAKPLLPDDDFTETKPAAQDVPMEQAATSPKDAPAAAVNPLRIKNDPILKAATEMKAPDAAVAQTNTQPAPLAAVPGMAKGPGLAANSEAQPADAKPVAVKAGVAAKAPVAAAKPVPDIGVVGVPDAASGPSLDAKSQVDKKPAQAAAAAQHSNQGGSGAESNLKLTSSPEAAAGINPAGAPATQSKGKQASSGADQLSVPLPGQANGGGVDRKAAGLAPAAIQPVPVERAAQAAPKANKNLE